MGVSTGYYTTSTLSDIEAFADFMRMLAPPVPALPTPSTIAGRAQFISVGCATCHTPSLTTGAAIATGSSRAPSPHFRVKPPTCILTFWCIMGQGLADAIAQGQAGPDEFRTALQQDILNFLRSL